MYCNKIKQSAFSLIELSIVLIIIAIALGSGLAVFKLNESESKIVQTQNKMQAIMTAVKKFALRNKYLPCPANPSDIASANTFGVSGTYTAGSPVTCGTSVANSSGISKGMVPVTTLGLYPSAAVDAWGNRFGYVVVASKTNYNISTSITDVNGFIEVRNYEGSGIYSSATNNYVAVLLISYGENGYGSYSGNGGAQKSGSSGNTKETSNMTTAGPYYTSFPTAKYDDIINFWTVFQVNNENLME